MALFTSLGLGLRLWKIGHGLPHFYYGDEGLVTYLSLNLGGGDLNPHHFIHPHLYYYLCFLVDLVYILGGLATGIFRVPSDAWQLYLKDPTVFYLMGRSVSVVLGTLTIPLTFSIGKKVFNGKAGLAGAFFLAFAFIHLQWSPIVYMDVPFTFFVVLAFLFAFSAMEKGELRYFILAGLVSGFAMSTKYQGLPTLLWGPLAGFLFALKKKTNPYLEILGKRTLLFFLFFILGFTAGTPYWILDFPEFKNHMIWDWVYFRTGGKGQLGLDGEWNWFYYLFRTLPPGLGLPLWAISLAGMGRLALRLDRNSLFFVSFPFLYFLISGSASIGQSKYAMPLVPFLCLAGGFFLKEILSKRMGPEKKGFSWALAALSVLVILPSFLSGVRYNYLKIFPDTREVAYAWVKEHVGSDQKILQTFFVQLPSVSGGPEIKRLDPTVFDQRRDNQSTLQSLDEYRREGFRYLILDEWHLGNILVEGARFPKYHKTVRRYQNFLKEVKERTELLASFSPVKRGVLPFDRENVEIPSRSLWKIKSTGPQLWIYRL